ncbi:MAG: FG-GAP repeat protein [Trueperaceae bacterium]|nr:FG-GAP repeat protein [Trueperaceae bacterium]
MSDPDGDVLSCTLDTDGDGTSEYTIEDCGATTLQTHAYAATGSYAPILSVSDGRSENVQANASVTVDEPNAPPVLSGIDDQRTIRGNAIEIPFSVSDENPSGVTVTGVSDDPTLVADADIEILASGADRTLRITPAPFGTGGVTITLTALDEGGLEDTQAFMLEVAEPFQTTPAKLTASDGADNDRFGSSVAIDGDYAIIGAEKDDLTGLNEGSAYAFKRSGDSWVEIDKLTASDAATGDRFGHSVAVDGDYAIIGASSDDLTGEDEGSAYAFKRNGDTWVEIDKLTASDAAYRDAFGWSVAIDGEYAIIGASKDDLTGNNEGSAYAFTRNGDSWAEVDKLTASDAADDDLFGNSVAIDGDYAIIGALRDDLTGAEEGSAYAFTRNGDSWAEVDKLTASDAADNDFFGNSVAIEGDYAIIGASSDDLTGNNEGSAYAFKRNGDSWAEVDKLTASDAADYDLFGNSVAIDGNYAIIGARRDDLTGADEGSAYAFTRSGDSWAEVDKLTASDAADGDRFGWSVAIEGDYAIIGAYIDDLLNTNEGSAYNTNEGSAYVFMK